MAKRPSEFLDDEERGFLGELLRLVPAEQLHSNPVFTLDGEGKAAAMLEQLGNQQTLELKARHGDYELLFPVLLARDDFGRLTLELCPPKIIEHHEQRPRDWRLQPAQPIRLLDPEGQDTGMRIYDMSLQGVCVRLPDAVTDVPDEMTLMLELPNCGSQILVQATKVRDIDAQHSAYLLYHDEPQQRERLRRFLYEQHQQLHLLES